MDCARGEERASSPRETRTGCRLRWTNCRDSRGWIGRLHGGGGRSSARDGGEIRREGPEFRGANSRRRTTAPTARNDPLEGYDRPRSARVDFRPPQHDLAEARGGGGGRRPSRFRRASGTGRCADAVTPLLLGHCSQKRAGSWLKLLKSAVGERARGSKRKTRRNLPPSSTYARVGKGANGEAAASRRCIRRSFAGAFRDENDVQCRERWTRVLDPALTDAEWTSKDDAELAAAVRAHEERGERPGESRGSMVAGREAARERRRIRKRSSRGGIGARDEDVGETRGEGTAAEERKRYARRRDGKRRGRRRMRAAGEEESSTGRAKTRGVLTWRREWAGRVRVAPGPGDDGKNRSDVRRRSSQPRDE